jgi:hypothetical protein
MGFVMKHEYDLFEKFPDGSSLWRDSVSGIELTRLRIREMAQISGNRFYAIDMTTGEVLAFDSERGAHELRTPSLAGMGNHSQSTNVR